MADTVFRSQSTTESTPEYTPPETKYDNTNIEDTEFHNSEPIDSSDTDQTVLNALGIEDSLQNLADDDRSNLSEVSQYLLNILSKKGVSPTKGSLEHTLTDLKAEMGLEDDADADMVLERIGGVVKAWKELSFVTNAQEKRSLFMKLARQSDSKAMNKMVFDEMTKRSVWN